MFWSYQVAEVFARRCHRHNEADMHPICFDEYIYAFGRLFPIAVCWNVAANERHHHVKADHQQWPPGYRTQCGPQAVDAKQFQV